MTGDQDLHHELRAVAREMLAEKNVDWPALNRAGWVALEAPESLGGGGGSFAQTAVILDEMGRAAAATPYLGSAVLAAGALTGLKPSPMRDALIDRLVTGSARVAVGLPTDGSGRPAFRFDGDRIWGCAGFVPDAEGADELLLLAADSAGTPLMIRAPACDLALTAQPVLDETRSLAEISAAGVPVDDSAVLRFNGDPSAAASRLLNRARLAVACDSLGLGEAMLAATVGYAKVRRQFGRAIGSFQAVKHACADMLVEVSVCRRLVAAAVEAVAGDDGDATTAVRMAKAGVCGAAVHIVGKAMQLHGGIGYTWENGIHVYFKRASLNRALFGTPEAHRRQLAMRYL